MKQNVLILFALCLISLLFTGCSQNNASHENHISSDILDLNSSAAAVVVLKRKAR